jgi:hypothetical protein
VWSGGEIGEEGGVCAIGEGGSCTGFFFSFIGGHIQETFSMTVRMHI